ncbi:MAG TPA: condensation domain-containing protein, partial [Thermoanaerobaculia bacterium]|nr:condensation domain-containing protein [Thermoanaerobaculia bacterium]
NLLVLRLDLSGDPELVELVRRAREVVLGAQDHQDLPFEILVERLQPLREPGRRPLVQAHFSLESEPLPRSAAAGVEMVPAPVDHRITQYELDLNLVETDGGLAGDLIYASDLFEDVTVGRLLVHLESILQNLVERPEARLREVVQVFAEAEKRWRSEVVRSLGQSSRDKLRKVARRPTAMADIGVRR